jgi:hypothetical protein
MLNENEDRQMVPASVRFSLSAANRERVAVLFFAGNFSRAAMLYDTKLNIHARVRSVWASAALLLLLLAPASHAQIYKWVDAKGQVHYSDRKEEASIKAEALKVDAAAHAVPAAPLPDWKQREAEYKRRQRKARASEPVRSDAVKPVKSYYSNEPETDASRCRLARDVISGAARHTNLKPTDDYDRDIAKRDVRNFCH